MNNGLSCFLACIVTKANNGFIETEKSNAKSGQVGVVTPQLPALGVLFQGPGSNPDGATMGWVFNP